MINSVFYAVYIIYPKGFYHFTVPGVPFLALPGI